MKELSNQKLINSAKKVVNPKNISSEVQTGSVGCALITNKGKIYQGVSIHACCGVGFCAEHSAIAAMVTGKEFEIKKIVAVNKEGKLLPPCGRCRELMYQISKKNLNTKVLVEKNKEVLLKKLLPMIWQEK